MSFTTKYLASLRPSAEILEGSLVRVAEKRSFWQDDSRVSSMREREGGKGNQAGETASCRGNALQVRVSAISCLRGAEELDREDGGRVAARTCASQS